MKEKHHEFILRAFLEAKIPEAIKHSAPQLIDIDSVIGGYCSQLLKAKGKINIQSDKIISANEKQIFSKLINEINGNAKEELLIYYRLAILTESILYQYRSS
jgi:hypothetical protein